VKKLFVLLYGIFAYTMFFGIFLYSIAFTGNIWIARSLDSPQQVSMAAAILIDLLLLTVFAVQHSVMARPFFKKWLTKYIPEPAERSTYVLMSNLAMILLLAFWQPIGPVIWQIENVTMSIVIYGLFFLGWAILFTSTCLINHFDLFGLRQVWLYFIGKPYTQLRFRTPGFYKFVRHPLYVGWIMIFWFSPVMSASHLLFAVACTAYILIAIQFEERDLEAALGVDYRRYKNEVPMLVPSLRRKPSLDESGVTPANL